MPTKILSNNPRCENQVLHYAPGPGAALEQFGVNLPGNAIRVFSGYNVDPEQILEKTVPHCIKYLDATTIFHFTFDSVGFFPI